MLMISVAKFHPPPHNFLIKLSDTQILAGSTNDFFPYIGDFYN